MTKLVEHPVLSDDVIVTDVSSRFEQGVHSIRAAFEQPRLLFCSASGRVWRLDRWRGRSGVDAARNHVANAAGRQAMREPRGSR